jgi:hypothetical protein
MRSKPIILLSVAILAGIILLARRDELKASPITECGFWGAMSEGMSCR